MDFCTLSIAHMLDARIESFAYLFQRVGGTSKTRQVVVACAYSVPSGP